MPMVLVLVGMLVVGAQGGVDARDADGLSALMRAAARGDAAEVKALADKGADLNQRHDPTRVTPLMFAAFFGHAEVVKLLVARGADIGLKDSAGASAADWAAQDGHEDLVKVLTGPTVSLNPFLNTGTLAFGLMDTAAGKPQ